MKFNKYKLDANEIAKEFENAYPAIKLCSNSNTFYEYQNKETGEKGYYKRISALEIKSKINEFCAINNIQITNASIIDNAFKLFHYSSMSKRVEFDRPEYKYLLNVKNCILNIESGTVQKIDHSPDYYITRQFNVIYNAEAVATANIKALSEILPDEQKRKYFLKIMMYLLIPTYEFQKIWILYGNGGNGKDTALKPIQSILGVNNYSTVSSYDLAENKFLMGYLKDKHVNISSEQKTGRLIQDNLKKLSGDSSITVDVKNQDPIQFNNYARLIMLTNEIPQLDEMNESIKRRYTVINFDQTFSGYRMETDLKDILCTEEEKSGFLNLLLEQLPSILRTKGQYTSIYFQEPLCILKETNLAFNEMNNIEEFVNSMCDINAIYESKANAVYEIYQSYCKNHKVIPIKKRLLR